jgi:hypothetical protein
MLRRFVASIKQPPCLLVLAAALTQVLRFLLIRFSLIDHGERSGDFRRVGDVAGHCSLALCATARCAELLSWSTAVKRTLGKPTGGRSAHVQQCSTRWSEYEWALPQWHILRQARRGVHNPVGTLVRGSPPNRSGYDRQLEDAQVQVSSLVR